MVKKRCISFIVILVFLFKAMVLPYNITKAEEKANSHSFDNLIKKFDEEMPKILDKYDVPGCEILLIDQGQIWEKGYGYADKAKKSPMSKNTVFQVGSISKTITAWGVMKLVEEGKIDLDAPVEKYLTRWHFDKSKYDIEGVTVRRLLSHTAGVSVQGYDGVEPSNKLITIEESLSGKVNKGTKVELVSEPGSKYQYSGGGYAILQLLIEEVSKTSFEKYIETEILKPLGMINSGYELDKENTPNLAKAYGTLSQELPNYIYTEKAAAGLYTTAGDLGKLELASMKIEDSNLIGAGVLKPETVDLMTKPAKNALWGLGYQITELPDGEMTVGHGGTNRGWRGKMVELKEKGKGLVVLTNSDMGQNAVAEVEAAWIKEYTGQFPEFYKAMNFYSKCITIVMTILGVLVLAAGTLVIKNIIRKKRRFIAFNKVKSWQSILKIIAPLLGIFLLWAVLHGPVVHGWSIAGFLPFSTKNLSILITVCLLFLSFMSLFPKKKISVQNFPKDIKN